ncbi:hypothetical protein GCM10010912_58940 [Paenibacillus albidus]|uniref:N-acetyltransferase n=1 Tax=Paenibacillus albidus TaxID=2041023 RepID=A0A917FVF8_9BACL|nr:GNAT family protein [Paenibacillus albidus]GGG06539.1 hypothetical protein GCM10010912_58940 [Paenibacillus albidus]
MNTGTKVELRPVSLEDFRRTYEAYRLDCLPGIEYYLTAYTWSGNVRAIRSYEKCGFVVEGRLRNDAYVDGKYYDTVIMGLLKEDFKMREKRI